MASTVKKVTNWLWKHPLDTFQTVGDRYGVSKMRVSLIVSAEPELKEHILKSKDNRRDERLKLKGDKLSSKRHEREGLRLEKAKERVAYMKDNKLSRRRAAKELEVSYSTMIRAEKYLEEHCGLQD